VVVVASSEAQLLKFWMALCLLGCNSVRPAVTPVDAVMTFVAALEQSTADRDARARVYGLLSKRARDSLIERAARSAQVAGRPFEPWEMIAPGRGRVLIRPSADNTMTRIEDNRAIVTVRSLTGTTADVPLVRENGAWRLDLVLPTIAAPRPETP
jgi:hypothetical protein